MQKLMMMICASVGVAVGATAAISAEDLAAAVKERRDLMKKTVAPAAKLGGQMIKGVEPFHATKGCQGDERYQRRAGQICDAVPQGNGARWAPLTVKFPIRTTEAKPNRRSGRSLMTSRRWP